MMTPQQSSTRSLPRVGSSWRLVSLTGLMALGLVACSRDAADGPPDFRDAFERESEADGTPRTADGDPVQPAGGGDSPSDSESGASISLSRPASVIGEPVSNDATAPLDVCGTPGPRTIRRLNSEQYRNTVVSLFSVGGQALDDADFQIIDQDVLTDVAGNDFLVDSNLLQVEGLGAERLMTYALSVADWAVNMQFSNNLGALGVACQDNNDNCRRQFVQTFGSRVARQPLSDDQVARYVALMAGSAEAPVATFAAGVQRAIAALLQSPSMLYRSELGERQADGTYRLTQYEIASELSYFLTNSPPDAQLLAAAQAGQLDRAGIDQHAARLLATPQADAVWETFVSQWMRVERLQQKAKTTPVELTPALRDAMLSETERLFLSVLKSGGTIGELFGANYTFATPELAAFYGLGTPDAQGRVSLEGSNRVPGLIGQGAFLAEHAQVSNSSPVQRAYVVRERILCDEIPEVPPNLEIPAITNDPNVTNRERYAAHSEVSSCNRCHQLMDPVGFAFEAFDAVGQFRTTEGGQPVDSNGQLRLLADNMAIPLSGAADLATFLADSEAVRACTARYMSYFAYGQAGWAGASCTENTIRMEARGSGNTLQSVLMGVLHAPHFSLRVQEPDMAPAGAE